MLQAGFTFVELYVEEPAFYARIFCEALGFAVERDEGDFMELRTARAIVLLNSSAELEGGHPFQEFRQHERRGLGVEIGIVVTDIWLARQAAVAIPGCRVTEIVEQDWGMTDFRILTPHGYYLRVTAPRAALSEGASV